MRQSYYDLQLSVQRLNDELAQQQRGAALQKIFSSAHFIVCSLRLVGRNIFIYLGRGKEFEGVYLHDENVPSAFRKRDSFLEYLRSHFKNSSLLAVILDTQDRAVCFKAIKEKRENYFLFFWRGRELFFIHYQVKESGSLLFCSWKRRNETLLNRADVSSLFDYFNEVGRKSLKQQGRNNNVGTIAEYFTALEQGAVVRSNRKEKFLKRKLENIKSDLVKFKRWEKLYLEVQKDQYTLRGEKFNEFGVRIKFKAEDSYYKRKSQLLDKLKRFKDYYSQAVKRLQDTEQLLALQQGKREDCSPIVFNPITHKQSWEKIRQRPMVVSGVNYFAFAFGKVGVGSSATANDFLRSKWADKEDFWFHFDGDRGPHAILKLVDKRRPTLEEVAIIASLLRDHAHLERREINIIYTQVKHLKAVRKSPGKVIYRKEKHLQVIYRQWRQNLLEF